MHDEIHPAIKWFLLTVGVAALFSGVAGGLIARRDYRKVNSEVPEPTRRPDLIRELGRGVRLRTGGPDSPVLFIRSFTITKRKMGPFALGGFNMAEIQDFTLIFSAREESLCEREKRSNAPSLSGINELFHEKGWRDLCEILNADQSVSGLLIYRLTLTMEGAAGRKELLYAERGEGLRDGTLQLKNIRFVTEQDENRESSEGILIMRSPITLLVGRERINLQNTIKRTSATLL